MIYYTIWALTAILYVPVFYQLYRNRWVAVDYTHAYFILPVALWIVWRNRRSLMETVRRVQPADNYPGLFLICLGIAMYIFGWRHDYMFLNTLSLIPLICGLTDYLYGRRMVKAVLFPVLYLLLLVPVPSGIIDNITLPMRFGVSVATEKILSLFHYPITREGLLMFIGDSELFMGQPCSGFRSIVSMLSLGVIYVYIVKGGPLKKGVLIFSIIPLALAGNLVRVMGLCLVAYYLGENACEGLFHDLSGIAAFITVIFGLVGLDHILSSPGKDVRT
ncbi:MAG: exosortase/archaeosortase family protein [Candidatus Kuenenia stuttgartiensis]|nr:exosortase/archaeosortase family protein [Candidatus Kuenenia stuttgartiensis]